MLKKFSVLRSLCFCLLISSYTRIGRPQHLKCWSSYQSQGNMFFWASLLSLICMLSIISGVQWFLVNVSPFHLSQKCTLTKAFFLSFFNFVSSQVSNYKNSVTVWRSHRIWWILYSVCVHGQVSKWMVFLFLSLIHTTNMTLWKHLNSFKFPMG